jgi:hypothetical protein
MTLAPARAGMLAKVGKQHEGMTTTTRMALTAGTTAVAEQEELHVRTTTAAVSLETIGSQKQERSLQQNRRQQRRKRQPLGAYATTDIPYRDPTAQKEH